MRVFVRRSGSALARCAAFVSSFIALAVAVEAWLTFINASITSSAAAAALSSAWTAVLCAATHSSQASCDFVGLSSRSCLADTETCRRPGMEKRTVSYSLSSWTTGRASVRATPINTPTAIMRTAFGNDLITKKLAFVIACALRTELTVN